MNKSGKWRELKLLFPLILFLLLAFFFLSRDFLFSPHAVSSPLIDKSVPPFRLHSLFDPKKTITEHIFFRHVTVLNIFATWCVSCRAEHAVLMNLHEKHPAVQLVGVAFKDSRARVMAYLQKYGNPFDVVVDDADGVLATRLDVSVTPETIVIDESGIVRSKIIGPISPEMVKDELVPLIRKLQKAK